MDLEFINFIVLILLLVGVSYLVYRTARKYSSANSSAVYVDTSVLIDGRIVDLAATGFVPGDLVIPRSVLRELQLLADGTDHDKREKARRGLDVVRHLQESADVNVEIFADGINPDGVDERLMQLCKKNGGKLLTIDYNLNKVAQVEGITVLNINDLARQLRMSFLPGDKLRLELTQIGSNAKQGVGYLDDGTMVVVEDAKSMIGKKVDIEVTRSLQTAAGRMMFARLTANLGEKKQSAKPSVNSARRKSHDSHGRKPKGPKNGEDELVRLANR